MLGACNDAAMPDGRFAPSPTAPLHLGNLRTALAAWLFARWGGSSFRMRMEDLDPASSFERHGRGQLEDLAALGLDWDGPVTRQCQHAERFAQAIDRLVACRADLPVLVHAPRDPRRHPRAPSADAFGATRRRLPGHLPGPDARSSAASARPAVDPPRCACAAGGAEVTVVDRLCGPVTAVVDDLVLRRNDGVAAYNLAVVVDDDAQGIGEVVRGDDLLSSTPRQVHLAHLLGIRPPGYAHVPLVLGPDGERLAKRDGAVTLAHRRARGETPDQVRTLLAASLGLIAPGEQVPAHELVRRFDPAALSREPWRLEDC